MSTPNWSTFRFLFNFLQIPIFKFLWYKNIQFWRSGEFLYLMCIQQICNYIKLHCMNSTLVHCTEGKLYFTINSKCITDIQHSSAVVPRVCSITSSQGIHGYIAVLGNPKFISLIKLIMFFFYK
jgi:hypothetical protein